MAQGDQVVYNGTKYWLMKKVYDLVNDTNKVSLHTGYTPNIDTQSVWGDSGVSSTEYGTSGGYTAGGKTLANQTVTQDNTNDRALWDADDVTWTSLTLSPATPSHAIIRDTTPTGTPNIPLISYVVLGSTATNGGDYTLQWSTSPSAILSLT